MDIKNNIRTKLLLLVFGLSVWACTDTKEREAEQPESLLTITPAELSFPKEGGEQGFTVSTNRGWKLDKADGVWFDFIGEVVGEEAEREVTVKALPNEGVSARTARITVTAGNAVEELEVSQFGSQPEILLGKSSLEASCDAQPIRMIVNANVELTTASDSWITVEKETTGTPMTLCSRIYILTLEENRGATARPGKVTFSGEGAESKEVIITQAAFQPKVTVSNLLLSPGANQTEASLTVTTNISWTAEWVDEIPDWVDFHGAAEGAIGETKLKFKLDVNEYNTIRSAEFLIKYEGQTEPLQLKIAQQAAGNMRESDSLALAALWNAASAHGDYRWDFSKSMLSWKGVAVSSGRVRELELYGWTFTQNFPVEFFNMNGLRKLSCSKCTFGKADIPAEISQFVQLRELYFYDVPSVLKLPDLSALTEMEKLVIAGLASSEFETGELQTVGGIEHIGQLKSLERLELKGLALSELPADLMELPKLQYLSTAYSGITKIQPELAELASLKFLFMNNCKLAGKIPAELFTGTKLVIVDFAKNKLGGNMPVAMFQLQSLLDLRLSYNNLTGPLPLELLTSKINALSLVDNRLGTLGATTELDSRFFEDPRWAGNSGTHGGGGGWFGKGNICAQQEGYGWSNCE